MHFRSGEKHSNHGNDAKEVFARLVRPIRTRFGEQIPIILYTDSGFLSDENLLFFENEMKIKYVVIEKLYSSVYDSMLGGKGSENARMTAKRASWVC